MCDTRQAANLNRKCSHGRNERNKENRWDFCVWNMRENTGTPVGTARRTFSFQPPLRISQDAFVYNFAVETVLHENITCFGYETEVSGP